MAHQLGRRNHQLAGQAAQKNGETNAWTNASQQTLTKNEYRSPFTAVNLGTTENLWLLTNRNKDGVHLFDIDKASVGSICSSSGQ